MEALQILKCDERTAVILRGSTWGYNFLAFALLIDIMYRALVFGEGSWDLFALIVASGVISIVYAARHNVLILNRKSVLFMALGAIVAAIVAFLLAAAKVM